MLAIAAARLGFAPVLGVDNGRESVEAARANAAVNDVVLTVLQLDLRRESLPPPGGEQRRWSVVTANLLCPLLCELARVMRPAPDHLIAGGLLAGQASDVAAALQGIARRYATQPDTVARARGSHGPCRIESRAAARKHGGFYATCSLDAPETARSGSTSESHATSRRERTPASEG